MANPTTPTKEVNAGVHANIGMDFQKNCTIFLFLEKYEILKNQKYFIALEHLDDIVFGYLQTPNDLSKTETYQAKKSSSKWTLGGILEIIKKITETSQSIIDDPHPKTSSFIQESFFITNNTIDLKCKSDGKNFSCLINESTEILKFSDIDGKIKEKIISGSDIINFNAENISHLETLHFRFIDLGRTPKSQLEQLNGKFVSVFGDKIIDHKAALHTLYYALVKIERALNQKNIAKLADIRKRIESTQIETLINILTNKKKAFDFWREKKGEICTELNISLFDQKFFELHYENSFDKFKDMKASEHQKIFKFVNVNKNLFNFHTNDKDCIAAFLSKFDAEQSSTFTKLQLKATIAAAYIEVKNIL